MLWFTGRITCSDELPLGDTSGMRRLSPDSALIYDEPNILSKLYFATRISSIWDLIECFSRPRDVVQFVGAAHGLVKMVTGNYYGVLDTHAIASSCQYLSIFF